jgi:hypothetical protein
MGGGYHCWFLENAKLWWIFLLYTRIGALPDNLKQEVADFVVLPVQKSMPIETIEERKFGLGNGNFTMSPDFGAVWRL